MLTITHAHASERILAHVAEERLTQNTWHDQANDGRPIACLLGAIDFSVTKPSDCNAHLMPMWLAELTPTLFDGMPAAEMYPLARRYGVLVGRWHALSDAQWQTVLTRFLIRAIDDAVDAARSVAEGKPYWPQVEAACEQCKAALNQGDRGAAEAAGAAWAAAGVAGAAGVAARAAARAAGAAWAAAGVARAAEAARVAWAAEAAARAAGAAWAAAGVARAAEAAACSRLFTFLLDQIEAELVEVA